MVCLVAAIAPPMGVAAQVAPDSRDGFVVSGTVVNSITGEPISRALVRTSGQAHGRTTFSDTEGHFQFEGLPAGQIMLTAQKPGYFSEQDAEGYSLHLIIVGPNTGAQSLKLQPLSAISGRVTDAAGQPIERISVRLMCRTLRSGRKVWEPRGSNETDEDGHYRFHSLTPATYFVAVGPSHSESKILASGEKPTTGFPQVYFPGVPDLASAAPIQLGVGQQYQADFSLPAVPVYSVTGTITGVPPDHGIGLMPLTSSGDALNFPITLNSELGTFSIAAVPAGSYILKAMTRSGTESLHAEQRITVASNLDNVHLALSPTISIPVIVHMQARGASGSNNANGESGIRIGPISSRWQERPPISVALMPNQPNASEVYSSFEQRGSISGSNTMLLQNVEPGSYAVTLLPQQPWYVQSATYGQTNVLYDDITVAPGQSYPLDIALRDDGASLTISIRGQGSTAQPGATVAQPGADVVILPQPALNTPSQVLRGVTNNYSATALAPGDYLVFAFDRIEGLEYTNPDALSAYASRAAHVTLAAGQQAQVSLDLIHVGKDE